jgi:uncharacterized repeat protein (TIGR03803 family)
MRQKKFWFTVSEILAVLAVALMLPTGAGAASKYKVLYKFKGKGDGASPVAGLTSDGAGNLYGTTEAGGNTKCSGNGCGVVFELTPKSDGTWTESVLHRFSRGSDGATPLAGLTFDEAGNLYGTTSEGGGATECNGNGCGTVFELKPNSDGSWTESVLYRFTGGADGGQPVAGVIFDTAGNLFGTTVIGGDLTCYNNGNGCGTIFKLTPNANGTWTENGLYNFPCSFMDCHEGAFPKAGLIFDTAGNLYSTTDGGGSGDGTVFKLTPSANGSWTESVLHIFGWLPDGHDPVAGLIFDAAGNLYGTTQFGGVRRGLHLCGGGCGTVFRLSPNSDGSWTEHVFQFANHPAASPLAGLILDEVGNLYGTTYQGGPAGGGAIFKLTPNLNGSWGYSGLHVFQGKPALHPYDSLVLDKAGNLYGTTRDCGGDKNCYGVVFEITP